MSAELICAITVLDGMIYAEVEWDLRILKLESVRGRKKMQVLEK